MIYLILDPRAQTIIFGIRRNHAEQLYLSSVYLPQIHKTGANKTTLLVIGGSHAIYINKNGDLG